MWEKYLNFKVNTYFMNIYKETLDEMLGCVVGVDVNKLNSKYPVSVIPYDAESTEFEKSYFGILSGYDNVFLVLTQPSESNERFTSRNSQEYIKNNVDTIKQGDHPLRSYVIQKQVADIGKLSDTLVLPQYFNFGVSAGKDYHTFRFGETTQVTPMGLRNKPPEWLLKRMESLPESWVERWFPFFYSRNWKDLFSHQKL